jgi:hypothetical protein
MFTKMVYMVPWLVLMFWPFITQHDGAHVMGPFRCPTSSVPSGWYDDARHQSSLPDCNACW